MTIQPSFVGNAWKGVVERVPRADRLRHLAGREVAGEGVLQDRDLAVEHADVDHLAFAAALALVQRGQDADRRVQAGGDVALRDAGPHRRPARLAGDAHDAAHALDDDVERRPVAVGPRLAEAGGRGVDEARVARAERLVADAERCPSCPA